MSASISELLDRIVALEKRVGAIESKPRPIPSLPVCEACGEGNMKLKEHKVRDDMAGQTFGMKMKVYRCDSCEMEVTRNDSD